MYTCAQPVRPTITEAVTGLAGVSDCPAATMEPRLDVWFRTKLDEPPSVAVGRESVTVVVLEVDVAPSESATTAVRPRVLLELPTVMVGLARVVCVQRYQ